jgi:hypothetical protein
VLTAVTLAALWLAGTARGDIVISEFMADNSHTITNKLGLTSDWIEIFNGTEASTNLLGWHLTDNAGSLAKWTFPSTNVAAGAYVLVYASGNDGILSGELHANFALNKDGEYLALVRPDMSIACQFSPKFPPQYADVSYGIGPTNDLQYFYIPTPGATNIAGMIGTVADTKFTPDRGFYSNAISVTIASATTGARIYYTTDSSEPTTNSALYTHAIPIANTTVIRAAAFKTGYFPTDIDTHTYIFLADVIHQPANPPGFPTNWLGPLALGGPNVVIPSDYEMDQRIVTNAENGAADLVPGLRAIPTMSIVTATSNMFSETEGLYFNLLPRYRAASVEWIDTNNATGFQINCGLKLHGNVSRFMFHTKKKSFGLKFTSEYGPSKLQFPMFDWDPAAADTFNELVLRGGSDDSVLRGASYVKDEFIRRTQLAMGAPCSHGTFVQLYINGLYWGLYNPVEALGTDLAANYFGGDASEWDAISAGQPIDGSSRGTWDQLLNLCSAGLSNNAAYQFIQGNNPDGTRNPDYENYLDVSDYIDYMILMHWAGMNTDDWPGNNWGAARKRGSDSSGFKFFSWDAELAFSAGDIVTALTGGVAAPYGYLRQNQEFRLLFADHVYKHCFNGGALSRDAVSPRCQILTDVVHLPTVGESARWGDMMDSNKVVTTRGGIFISEDHATSGMLPRWRNAGLYPGIDPPEFNRHGGMFSGGFQWVMTSTNEVYYTLDGGDPRECGTGAPVGTLYSAPVALTTATRVKARARSAVGEWSALHEAIFTPDTPSPLRITELMFHPRNPSGAETNIASGDGEFEFIELQNTGAQTAGLAGLRFTSGLSFDFARGGFPALGPGEYMVVVKNLAAFKARYADWASMKIAGEFQTTHSFPVKTLANGGEKVTLEDGLGRRIVSFTYSDGRGWPLAAAGPGHSLVPLVTDDQAGGGLDGSVSWRASAFRDGSPGAADPEPVRDVVLNEIMAHTDYPNGAPWQTSDDWIELYNRTAAPVTLSGGWYLSDDAADLEKWLIPATNVVEALGWLTFHEVGGFHPAMNSGFGLNKGADELYLSYLPGTASDRVVDSIRFYGQENGISLGRYPDGSNGWAACLLTPGASNRISSTPEVVISEIMYHPLPTAANPENNTNDEYVELYNPSSQPVTLMNTTNDAGVWRINGGIAFTFPSNTVMAAGEYIVLVSFDPATNAAALNAFLAAYGLTNGQIRMMGPYSGQLDNKSDSVRLERPVYPDLPGDPISWFVVDEGTYSDRSPWPTGADGTGFSLLRNGGACVGTDPASWTSAASYPGLNGATPMFPAAPLAKVAKDVSTDGFTANWQLSSRATNHCVDVATNIGFTAFVSGYSNRVVGNVPDLAIGGLTSGLYYYRIRAVNGAGTSENSATIAVMVKWPSILASGGTVTNYTQNGTNWTAHIFTNSGVFTVTAGGNVEILVVAGGGGGGKNAGGWVAGGGGAGGMIHLSGYPVSPYGSPYTVLVGAGGSGGSEPTNGGNSAFGTNTAFGGGRGAYASSVAPASGGSGGGGGYVSARGGDGITGQGYDGGVGTSHNGGGGGGAGGIGVDGKEKVASGDGGPGLESAITGESLFYAGGGGGVTDGSLYGPCGSGGSGIGGNGGGGKGRDGRGGGGGAWGGDGGSGAVIVRYALPPPTAIAVGATSNGFGDVFLNATGTWTYTVSGVSLSNDITITAPSSEFTIATNGGEYGSQVVLAQAGGSVPTTTINVHFIPMVEQDYSGTITNRSDGADDTLVTLTGAGIHIQPFLTVAPASLNLGNVITNKTSTNLTCYTLSGVYLTGDVTASAPAYFAVSTNASGPFADSCVVSVTQPTLSDTPIYVRFTPSGASGQYTGGSITNSSGGATNKMVAVGGTGVVQTLYRGAASLNFGYVQTTTTSNLSYTVSGSNLDNDVTLTVPGGSGFQIKTNGGASFGTDVTLTVPNKTQPQGGTLSARTIVVQFAPTAAQAYATHITAASAGAESKTTALSGNGAVQQIGVQQPAGTPLTDWSSTIDFGSIADAVKNFVVTNSGVVALTLSGNTKDGANPGDFTVGTLPTSLAVGASASFTVTFTPTASGARSAALHIGNGAGDGSFDVTLTGTGVPAAPFWAWGGDSNFTITVSGRLYAVHMYTNVGSGYFAPSRPIKNVEYLVIGGGGGGGGGGMANGGGGGGGGAGGYRSSVTNELSGSNSNAEERITLATTDPVAVTIGAGGAGATADLMGGTQGSPSSFRSIVAKGGGGGNDGLTGGSGGGQGYNSVGWVGFGRGVGTAGQGRDGGYLFDHGGSDYGGGGGGGASGMGGAGFAQGDARNAGQGGLGLTNSITGTAVLRGGGGCGGRSGQAGAGGGGSTKANGTDGTGGGGGGGMWDGGGGKGGAGIVIVRYDITPPRSTMFLLR